MKGQEKRVNISAVKTTITGTLPRQICCINGKVRTLDGKKVNLVSFDDGEPIVILLRSDYEKLQERVRLLETCMWV